MGPAANQPGVRTGKRAVDGSSQPRVDPQLPAAELASEDAAPGAANTTVAVTSIVTAPRTPARITSPLKTTGTASYNERTGRE
jgi:hypothetical protein